MYSNFLAMAFALASALTIAWGTVVRHRIAEETDGSPLLEAVTRFRWWVGSLTALLGYALQVVALGFGTLLVVQPILVLSLMFTLPLSARYDGRRPSRDEMGWAGALTVAVAVLVVLGKPAAGDPQPPMDRWLLSLGIGAVILLALWFISGRLALNARALVLGAITGGVYGYVAVLSKATVDIMTHGGITTLVFSWQGYSLLFGAILGTVIQQYAFNAGPLKNSLPAMTIVEPIVAFALGYAVLGEQFQVYGLNWAFMAAALVTMVVSTFALSWRGVGS
ncbi:membrane protein [Corynebacterium diphtheriae]|uniref:DMT family transporter n=1 Tax=Corynebacterium diphtheriae TaxID=1717 RepID=UPI0013C8F553|nr:DMT family transporter [Corynebacterium diphtheriae]MBG9372194.1 DMT family transporter [Corynebacterium diphtheriae bv. mitis]CAB0585904.1 membrane protein [Corynebacterium diphtheriae]CAB0832350.1 membrane protein [Corynebacterium diphtheriae]